MKNVSQPTIWLLLGGFALLSGAGASYYQYGSYSDEVKKQRDLSRLVVAPAEVQAERDKTAQELADAQSKLVHLEKGVPGFAYIPTLLKELEEFGKAHGIDVFGVRPIPSSEPTKDQNKEKEKRRPKAYVELLIEVKGRGQYGNVMRFITDLQKFPKILGVDMVTLSPKIDTSDRNLTALDLTLSIKAYLFPPGKDDPVWTGAPADAPIPDANNVPPANSGTSKPGAAKPGAAGEIVAKR